MSEYYVEGKEILGLNLTSETLSKGEYENCVFKNCSLTNGSLSGYKFIDCQFVDCDLSMTKLIDTSMNGVLFKSCKMLGLHFDDCKSFLFDVRFENCQLNLTNFYKVSLKKLHSIAVAFM
ncbi:MAG: fluoroquinolone resistance protein [Cyclobacteriaceae bacterium]|jgi:fluoroquinolone resistance protein